MDGVPFHLPLKKTLCSFVNKKNKKTLGQPLVGGEQTAEIAAVLKFDLTELYDFEFGVSITYRHTNLACATSCITLFTNCSIEILKGMDGRAGMILKPTP